MRLSIKELEEIRQGYHPEAAKSWSLHTDCYTDPDFLALDQTAIFHKNWQFICHSEKLTQPGSYIATDIQGQSIVVCRDKYNTLRAFYNVCKHRGHELMSGEGITNLITCPYHGWSYGLDGHLLKARRSELIDNFDAQNVCLSKIQVEVFCHLVFVNLDNNAPSLSTQTGELESEIMRYAPDINNLTFAHRLTYQIKANWKAVIDNFLECYHCPIAHRDFCSLVEMDTYKVKTHGIYSSHMAKAGRSNNTAYSIEDASVTDHAVWYLWPNTALMRYPGRGNFMVWRFYPSGPEETSEVFDFFLESSEPNEAEVESFRFIDEILQPEDIGLVESVQRGMRTPAFKQGRYLVDPDGSGLSEHAVHHFHGLILEAYQSAIKKQ